MKDTPKDTPADAPVSVETILEEAQRLVHGNRGEFYGPPAEDFGKTAAMMSGLLLPKLKPGETVSVTEAILFMVLVKVSRESHRRKRDNAVDIAGYAALLEMIGNYREETQ